MSDEANGLKVPLTPEEKSNLLNEIGNELVSSARENWIEISYIIDSIAIFATAEHLVTYPGKGDVREPLPNIVMRKSKLLRSSMHEEGRGTWFTMKMHIIRPGRYKVEYDYNGPPDFDLPPTAESYAEEQKRFPRSPENMPDWFKKELYKAGWYD